MTLRNHILAIVSVTSILVPIGAKADDDAVARTRAALITLAIDVESYKSAPEPVRCPIYGANLSVFMCAAVNGKGETVGSVVIFSGRLPPASRRELVERCASVATVADDCVAELTVEIDTYGARYATGLKWVAPL